MDRLEAMRAFVQVADSGTFSRAAEALRRPKSVVSKQVRQLEDHLQVRLLHRTTRRLSLTEVGQAYYTWCRRITQEVAEAESAVGALHTEARGELRVNAPMSFGYGHLAPALPSFHAQHPNVRVSLTMTDRQVDLVEEGYDLGIRIGRLADSSLIARKLSENALLPCASPTYLDTHGRPETPADLRQHACLHYTLYGWGAGWKLIHDDGTIQTVTVTGPFEANNGDAIHAATLGGMGIELQPAFIVQQDLDAGRVEQVLPDWQGPKLEIHAIYPPNRYVSTKVRAFLNFLKDRF